MKVIALGWREERAAASTKEIKGLLKDHHDRTLRVVEKFIDVGKHLDKSVKSYNEAATTLEARLLPVTRKFKKLGGIIGEDIPEVPAANGIIRDFKEGVLK